MGSHIQLIWVQFWINSTYVYVNALWMLFHTRYLIQLSVTNACRVQNVCSTISSYCVRDKSHRQWSGVRYPWTCIVSACTDNDNITETRYRPVSCVVDKQHSKDWELKFGHRKFTVYIATVPFGLHLNFLRFSKIMCFEFAHRWLMRNTKYCTLEQKMF